MPKQDELDEYLAEPPEEFDGLDVLSWWKARGKWPRLQLMVRQFFAVPASSAGIERAFSQCTKTVSRDREGLKDSTVKSLILTAKNITQ